MSDAREEFAKRWAGILRETGEALASLSSAEEPTESPTLDQLFGRVGIHKYERDGESVPIPPVPRRVFGLLDYQPTKQKYRCTVCAHSQWREAGSFLWLYGVPVKCEPLTE